MKKILIFLGVIILIFAGIILLNNAKNKTLLENNPYGTNNLDQATIDQLEDPNYQNVILPDELATDLEDAKSKTIYFFSPKCSYCKQTTPVVVPLAKDMGIDLELYNLLEFEEGWNQYKIEGTPTIIHFKDGKEVQRVSGYAEREVFEEWFNKYVLNE